jgi:hypothetical protein
LRIKNILRSTCLWIRIRPKKTILVWVMHW